MFYFFSSFSGTDKIYYISYVYTVFVCIYVTFYAFMHFIKFKGNKFKLWIYSIQKWKLYRKIVQGLEIGVKIKEITGYSFSGGLGIV